MKLVILRLCIFFGVLILSGCSIFPEGEHDIVISFTTKSLSPSFLKSSSEARVAEKYLKEILIFGVDDEEMVVQTFPPIEQLSSTDGFTLQAVSGKVKRFYAIANPTDDIKETPSPSNVSELTSMTCDFSNSPHSPFVMGGIGKFIRGSATQIELVRTVAKIDITASNGFEIEAVAVKNTPAKGYVFDLGALSVPDESITEYRGINPVSSTLATLYVAPNSMNSPTTFVVTGKFDGRKVNYSFELTHNSKKINIMRDTYYKVNIAPVTHSEGNITITIPQWEDVVADAKNIPKPSIDPPDPPDPPNPPNFPDYKNDGIKILAIGNSYSENSLLYLFDMLAQLGVKTSTTKIVNAYISGGTFEHHANNIRNNNYNNLEQQIFTANGNITKSRAGQFTLRQLLQDEKWDIITVQQQNGTSTNWTETDNQNFNTLIDFIKTNANKSANFRMGWHMTWAFGQSYFNSNRWLVTQFQTPFRMYELICSAVESKIVPHSDFDFIIPTGTAIQNALSTTLFGDNLQHDGSHLNNLGCYIGGAMWVKSITGYDISDLRTGYVANKTWGNSPSVTINAATLEKIVQAVNAAAASPLKNTY